KSVLEDAKALSVCVETAVIAHISVLSNTNQARFSYWRNSKEREVDLLVETGAELVPFEVKYQSQPIQTRDISGLIDLCHQKHSIEFGYVLTKDPKDIGPIEKKLMRIPTSIFCYWLGAAEANQQSDAILR